VVLTPSCDLGACAARPPAATRRRYLFAGSAAHGTGANLLSYLLFDREYCRALIRQGFDAMARRDEIVAFSTSSVNFVPLFPPECVDGAPAIIDDLIHSTPEPPCR
jgi:hypothetical protein